MATKPDSTTWHSGFVLHTRPYSNTSLIAEVFSADQGRVSLLAKGARTARSRFYSLLQPFVPLQFRWAGRGELQTLFDAEAQGGPCLPAERSFCGFYLNELLLRLLHKHDPHPPLLQAYAEALAQLAERGDIEPPLRYFEVQLLNEIGYGLELDVEVDSGGRIDANAWYEYRVEQGPVRISAPADKGLTVRGRTLLALRQQSLNTPEERYEAKQLLRALLAQYLGDKPLQSRRLFNPGLV